MSVYKETHGVHQKVKTSQLLGGIDEDSRESYSLNALCFGCCLVSKVLLRKIIQYFKNIIIWYSPLAHMMNFTMNLINETYHSYKRINITLLNFENIE